MSKILAPVNSDPSDGGHIEFDKAKYQALRKAYDKAIKDKADSFMFENKEIVTNYAKYLLEYLKTIFEK